jgi:murein DD-endopeptidase
MPQDFQLDANGNPIGQTDPLIEDPTMRDPGTYATGDYVSEEVAREATEAALNLGMYTSRSPEATLAFTSTPTAQKFPVSSEFGPREGVPGVVSENHNGIDFATPVGTPIYSVTSGVVLYARFTTGGGNEVHIGYYGVMGGDVLEERRLLYTVKYLHLDSISPEIVDVVGRGSQSAGGEIESGFYIGTSGNTGTRTTGPHLHLEVIDHTQNREGTPVDPRLYLHPNTF